MHLLLPNSSSFSSATQRKQTQQGLALTAADLPVNVSCGATAASLDLGPQRGYFSPTQQQRDRNAVTTSPHCAFCFRQNFVECTGVCECSGEREPPPKGAL